MVCSTCGKRGHNSRTCPYVISRKSFKTRKKMKRCQCCGQYGYEIHAHHTRGRGNNSANSAIDLCKDCHLHCGHNGHFSNFPIKPQVCRILNRVSYWRTRR